MRTKLIVIIIALLTIDMDGRSARAADPAPGEVSFQVLSVHFSRGSAEFNKRFPNRIYYGDNNPGVSLQLLLTLNEGTLLPLARDAISVDTFVDDTYQNLLSGGDPNRYTPYGQNGQSSVSQDGRSVLFTAASTRPPAEDAGRIFVRGTLQARVSRGEAIVISNQLTLAVGQSATVGPFRAVLRSLSEQNGNVSVTLAVDNDAWRIKKARMLDAAGKVLSDERAFRLDSSQALSENSSTAYMTIPSIPKEPVTIEFTYLEKVETVRIPFEAQVDVGIAKAGPIEPTDGKSPRRRGAQTWPPPRDNSDLNMPSRRAPFNPAGKSAAKSTKPDKASVDLFSLTVAKPAPGEAKGVVWKNAPSPAFHASGFTIAKLMLSVPDGAILSMPPEGITINRFEDDKGGKLDTTVYSDASPSYSYYQPTPGNTRSPDEQQMLLNVSLAASPTPGATRCTLAGEVEAKVAHGETTNTSATLDFRKGQTFTAGPFTMKIETIQQVVPSTPGSRDNDQLQAFVTITGPNDKLRSFDFVDEKGEVVPMIRIDPMMRREIFSGGINRDEYVRRPVRFSTAPTGPVAMRVRHYTSSDTVKVPFELSTGIGL